MALITGIEDIAQVVLHDPSASKYHIGGVQVVSQVQSCHCSGCHYVLVHGLCGRCSY